MDIIKISRGIVLALFSVFSLTLALPAVATVLKIATIAPEGSEWMVEHRAAAT